MIRLITSARLRALEEALEQESAARVAAEARARDLAGSLRAERSLTAVLDGALRAPGTVLGPEAAARLEHMVAAPVGGWR